MTAERITYRQLDDLLSRLGFSRQRVEPKWLRYEHPASDTVIILVEKKPSEPVRVTDAVSARRHLLEKGLIGPQEFKPLFAHDTTPQQTVAGKKR